MIEIEFELDQVKTTIQGNLEDLLKDIIDKYLIKISKQPGGLLHYISNGKIMDQNKTIGMQMSEQDKRDTTLPLRGSSNQRIIMMEGINERFR